MNLPLAEKLRPKHWNEVQGQSHLLGLRKPLRLAFESGIPHNMIFWGPPGTGKTTLARLTALAFDLEWIAISAVLAGVKDIREAVSKAEAHQKKGRNTLLFIDEIHRFNKSQQDALLPFTESGLLTFVGATTENPSFEVNTALLSRSTVYVLKPLDERALKALFIHAQNEYFQHYSFDEDLISELIQRADGDGRRLLNLLEQLMSVATFEKVSHLTIQFAEIAWSTHQGARFDKKGDIFYEEISALHKSVRGSNPDAALYWLARMLIGGAPPLYLARRIIRMAWEDIGLADPRAIEIASEAARTFERLGSPEGELALASAVIYLSVAPKSNAAYMAFKEALHWVKNDKSREVPLHLRNAPTNFMKDLDYGKDYRYSHNEAHAYSPNVSYFPEGMKAPNWYQPVERGLEIKIKEKLRFLKALEDTSNE